MGRFHLLLIAAIAGLGAAGAALAISATGGAATGVFSISLGDGAVALASPEISPGRRVLEATNAGTEEHELVVLRTGGAPDQLAVGLDGVSIALSGKLVVGEDHAALGHDHGDQVLGLLPGESRRFQAELAPGRYVVFCQTGTHYLSGEHAALRVSR